MYTMIVVFSGIVICVIMFMIGRIINKNDGKRSFDLVMIARAVAQEPPCPQHGSKPESSCRPCSWKDGATKSALISSLKYLELKLALGEPVTALLVELIAKKKAEHKLTTLECCELEYLFSLALHVLRRKRNLKELAETMDEMFRRESKSR